MKSSCSFAAVASGGHRRYIAVASPRATVPAIPRQAAPVRPSVLDPLFAPAASLPGVGPRTAPLLERLIGEPDRPARVVDLLFHLPRGGVSRDVKGTIADAPYGETVTLAVTVSHHRPPPLGKRGPYRVVVEDDTGDVTLVFFHSNKGRLEKALPVGARRFVSGKLELWDGRRQMVHPERMLDEEGAAGLPAVEAIYGQTEGLSSRLVAKFIGAGLERVEALPEWQDRAWLERQGYPSFTEALRALHQPDSAAALTEEAMIASPARKRLAYDELLASQTALALVRSRMRRQAGRTNAGDGRLVERLRTALPFGLTGAQERAVEDIRRDLVAETRMLRLLQGDVRSGSRPVVALLAMASAIEAGARRR
jgi:ATP-dependent DNA helicase RecG